MILAIDPGRRTGWALCSPTGIESGVLNPDTKVGLQRAQELVQRADEVVIESMGYVARGARYDTIFGLARHASVFEVLARLQDKPVVWVHPNTWQKAMLHVGRRNPGRDMLKRLSMARARALVGHEVGADEADAILLSVFVATLERNGTRNRTGHPFRLPLDARTAP